MISIIDDALALFMSHRERLMYRVRFGLKSNLTVAPMAVTLVKRGGGVIVNR